MAMIKIIYWGVMRDISGKSGEELEASSVAQLLSALEKQYGKEGLKEAKRMLVAVNGTNIQLLNRYKTPLAQGDTVSFLPLSGGG